MAAQAAGIAITGLVSQPQTLSEGDLAKMPMTSETVFLHTGHGVLNGTFGGVSLWTLLQQVGLKTDPAAKNDIIRHTVVVTAKDGYGAVLSLGEIAPEFGNDQAIIATVRDGKPMAGTEASNRLVIPGDKSAGRSIENVVSIEVK
jgi:hypothetical protein